MKFDEEAKNNREIGNQFFKQKQLLAAAQQYTGALFEAASNREKSLAYGNRSLVLFTGGFYPETIEDVKNALSVRFFIILPCLINQPDKHNAVCTVSASKT